MTIVYILKHNEKMQFFFILHNFLFNKDCIHKTRENNNTYEKMKIKYVIIW